jgi:hypothetical protein
MKAKLTSLLVGAAALTWTSTAMAVSYASGVVKVGDDVTFILNQDAYSVQAILDGGAQTLNLPTTNGPVTFNMAGYSSYQIKVGSAEKPGWYRFIPDGPDRNFEYPWGVSINNNPMSTNFGKVYVSESRNGTTAAGRYTASGIYVLRADGVAEGGVMTGGVDWAGAGIYAPFKSTIGPDDHLYVADFSNDRAYEFNDDLSVATRVIDDSNKTSGQYVESVWVEGTQAGTDRSVYTVDSHYLDGRRGLIRYDLLGNAAATASDKGTQIIGPGYFDYYPRDVARDSHGDWYMNNYRATAGQAPAVVKFDGSQAPPINAVGANGWESSSSPTYTYGLGLNEVGGTVATASSSSGVVWFFDMATGAIVASFDAGTAVHDLAFDAVGNLVTVDNSTERARFWSPGGSWVSVLGSDGTFSVAMTNFPPAVVCHPTVTVSTDTGLCTATVTADQVDNGSFDPEGGPVTLELTPSSPYSLGSNDVTLTVTDTNGLSTSTNVLVIVLDTTPPTIVCPASLTVEAQDENGAVVNFVVTASDLCSSFSLVVTPASGSLFPIGVTSVGATATDAYTNSASCSFSVTVLGAQGIKSDVLAELVALRGSTTMNDSFAQKFDYVILHLQNSLNPAYWIDQTHPTPDGGNIALNEEKLAANMLDLIMSSKQCPVDPAILEGFINRILTSDRLLAMISIQEAAAAGLNAKKIAEDLAQVAKGDEEAAAGRYANAIEHYRNAWRHAIQLHLQVSQAAQGGALVRFIGDQTKSYLIEVSSDLLHWTPLGTYTPDAQGNVAFTDPNATNQTQRFYRAVEQ